MIIYQILIQLRELLSHNFTKVAGVKLSTFRTNSGLLRCRATIGDILIKMVEALKSETRAGGEEARRVSWVDKLCDKLESLNVFSFKSRTQLYCYHSFGELYRRYPFIILVDVEFY